MKFTGYLLATASLAGSVLAAPRSGGLADRIRARAMSRQSHPLVPVAGDENYRVAGTDASNVTYSSNWAGAVREQPPPNGPYTAVTATFKVPEPTAQAMRQTGTTAGSAWVGIDGDTYSAAILQTGIDFYLENGQTYNDAWFEWYPDYAYDFDITVNTGDIIVAKVEALSSSQGVATIENLSTGQTASQTVSAPAATATLGGQNADWIVEDFQSGDQMVSLTDFSEVTFWGAQAEGGGATWGVQDASIVELKQNNQVLTSVNVQSNSEFTVTYLG
ncbi:concanavalin A-like lectin/glucanase [Aspergillus heteromorphus CBS 117.55]|uniref:Concanavalin A-like lectin/glucanase n=1 Tax=Aspergillus heteromorphus CBS 117.55 TaxID=1448321 RepID=A0A317VZL5_9EURO|nr:concanavalin A-like lectin/glucanase [Aspergillus heteromorphus CBS 117.55]PWY79215.1 concanavalin A-like lectin/glucanase [Aspergillus heteromorphus CBS 117.55]